MTSLVSVVVTTYNWPNALRLVLYSLADQSDRNFEIIIADDGSSFETRQVIEDFAANCPLPIKHFWQEDAGFRVARARNGAISMSEGELVIFIDGDCCVMPDFVARHRNAAEEGCLVAGKRVFIKKRLTKYLMAKNIAFHKWPRSALFLIALFGFCNRPFQFVRLPHKGPWLWKHMACWRKAQTCNLAVFRKDIERVGGFDEAYEGHGLEDSDFVLRLLRSGLKRKNVEYCSPVLHLYHGRKIASRHTGSQNNNHHFQQLINDENRYLPRSDTLQPIPESATA
ncbi:glycosyltransferase family 2 protein [Thalassospira lucentensis]|uniref:glycosyltransferase family 2 protein n=1 Tax=Thalassospira lucentensis TaxID=168935 RepID=UPI0029434B4E|nr:glycosyltransferase family 2 protein [Thalassospira lucentensis]WOI12409.1 glycosyltransferase family 2 protein [Thalassospira lucentensis]